MPERNLKTALIAHDIITGSVERNLQIIDHSLKSLEPDTDLVVLPEMFSTGFVKDREVLRMLAEQDVKTAIPTIREWAIRQDAAFCGSMLVEEDGTFFNRGFFITSGSETFYDKHHLFRMGGEGEIYCAGSSAAPTVNFRSWNIRMSICYDLRFPVWNRNVRNDYDLLVVCANWPHVREYAWTHLLIARAIENQAYCIGCNRSGTDDDGEYLAEDSAIFDFWGKPIGRVEDSRMVYAVLDSEKLLRARDKFCIWRDADRFTLLPD